jgi:hypothetical protein
MTKFSSNSPGELILMSFQRDMNKLFIRTGVLIHTNHIAHHILFSAFCDTFENHKNKLHVQGTTQESRQRVSSELSLSFTSKRGITRYVLFAKIGVDLLDYYELEKRLSQPEDCQYDSRREQSNSSS